MRLAVPAVLLLVWDITRASSAACKKIPGHTDPHGKCQLSGSCCNMFWPPTAGSCDPSNGTGCTNMWPNDPSQQGCCQAGALAHSESTPPNVSCANETVGHEQCTVTSCCSWWYFEGPYQGLACSYDDDTCAAQKMGGRAGRCKTYEPDCSTCSTKCVEWYTSNSSTGHKGDASGPWGECDAPNRAQGDLGAACKARSEKHSCFWETNCSKLTHFVQDERAEQTCERNNGYCAPNSTSVS